MSSHEHSSERKRQPTKEKKKTYVEADRDQLAVPFVAAGVAHIAIKLPVSNETNAVEV